MFVQIWLQSICCEHNSSWFRSITYVFILPNQKPYFLFFLILYTQIFNPSHQKANPYLYQFFAYLPAKYSRIFLFQLIDFHFDLGRCHLRLGSTNHTWTNWSGFLISVENFRNTSMRDAQLSWYNTRPDTGSGHFDNFQAHMVG